MPVVSDDKRTLDREFLQQLCCYTEKYIVQRANSFVSNVMPMKDGCVWGRRGRFTPRRISQHINNLSFKVRPTFLCYYAMSTTCSLHARHRVAASHISFLELVVRLAGI